MSDVRSALRSARYERGWSQRQLIEAMRRTASAEGEQLPGFASLQSQVSDWEREKVTPSPFYQRLLCSVYEATPDDLGLTSRTARAGRTPVSLLDPEWTPTRIEQLSAALDATDAAGVDATTAARLAHEWLVTEPPQLIETTAGRHVGGSLVEQIGARVRHLRRLDDVLGGGDMRELVHRELTATGTLLREAAYTEDTGRRLLDLLGELCQLAGWVAGDAGLRAQAESYYVAGVQAAHAAGDAPLAANLISTLSYQVANTGDATDAVLLAQTASEGARTTATATTRALLLERLAWAHARRGDSRRCEQALTAVDHAYEHTQPADDPEWTYWLDSDEITIMAGRCYTELRQPQRAEPLLRAALDRYDGTHAREYALYSTWLADVMLQLGDVDQAATLALRALETTTGVATTRVLDRIATLRRPLLAHPGIPAVRDLDDLYQSLRLA